MRSSRLAALSVAVLVAACSAPNDVGENVGSTEADLDTVCGAATNGPVQGRDVSVYQGDFDWAAQKSAGVVFGIARIGDGTGGDSTFAPNWSKMKDNGILRGAYQFFEPSEDATTQANLMVAAVGKLGEGDLPCTIDLETTGGQSAATIRSKVKTWLDVVEAGTGKKPIIYTGPYFWADNVASTDFGDYPLWIADYGPACPLVPPGWTNWTMWQYSDGGGALDHDVFNGSLAELQKLAGAPQSYSTVVHRGRADINGDGSGDVCVRTTTGVVCEVSSHEGAPTQVTGPEWSDAKGWNKVEYYSTIQTADVNGDQRADLCARDAQGIVCELSNGNGFPTEIRGTDWNDAGGWAASIYDDTIQFGDVDGDGKDDACARGYTGVRCFLSTGTGFAATAITGPAYGDTSGWTGIQYYRSITLVDVNGDGKADVCARAAAGIECNLSDGSGFPTKITGPDWSDAKGWDKPEYGETIRWGDVNGDGKVDVCGRGPTGIVCELSDGKSFPTEIVGPAWSDANGWNAAPYYTTIQFADVDGNGMADLCARSAAGILCEISNGTSFAKEITGPAWSSASGWDPPQFDSTIGFADIDADGRDDVCGRSAAGMLCASSKGDSFADAVPRASWSDANGFAAEPYYASIRYGGAKVAFHGVLPTDDAGSGVHVSASADASVDAGCGCTTVGKTRSGSPSIAWVGALAFVTMLVRRRRFDP